MKTVLRVRILAFLICMPLVVCAENALPARGPASPLTNAINSNNKDTAISLLEQGADVNYVDYWSKTPLDYAAQKLGWSDVVQRMIDRGAICGAVRNNSSPIDTASDLESIVLLKACVLKQVGTSPSLNDTLYHAVRRGEPQLVLSLLTLGADINGQSRLNGQTPLVATLEAKNPEEMLKFLLDHGANVDAVSKSGMTLLGTLKLINKPSYGRLVSILLEHGANNSVSPHAQVEQKVGNVSDKTAVNERMGNVNGDPVDDRIVRACSGISEAFYDGKPTVKTTNEIQEDQQILQSMVLDRDMSLAIKRAQITGAAHACGADTNAGLNKLKDQAEAKFGNGSTKGVRFAKVVECTEARFERAGIAKWAPQDKCSRTKVYFDFFVTHGHDIADVLPDGSRFAQFETGP
jgi:hypothetical protein